MDMKRIIQTIDSASNKSEIINEGRGPLNRPTSAESIAMQHYTSPVLNVAEEAKPSMIGKYFATVEQELKEAAARPNERARQLAERVIERIVPNADGSLPDPSINRLTGKPNPPAAEPAPTNVKPSGSTVEYGGATYNVVGVFGDGIRPRIGMSGKVIPAKAYVVGDKMYVLLDPSTQEDLGESERTMSRAAKGHEKYGKEGMAALAKAGRAGASDEKLDKIRDKHDKYDSKVDEVAGPEKCWPGHRKVGTKPGTGKNAGKRVNDCEAKKKAGKK